VNVLMVGVGAGSWDVRGRQLGGALGARVCVAPTPDDFGWADVIVLVKRAMAVFGQQARQSGKPVVWDVLDIWQQPAQNTIAAPEATALVRRSCWAGLTLLGATKAMADAIGGRYLPHHAWPGLTPAPARPEVRVVAYQGAPHYLGRWATWVTEACARRGWQFVVNPRDLREADILLALRDGQWDGWICREWKSGVKVVNAIAAGRPLISQDGAAVREIRPDGSIIHGPDSLAFALDHWADFHNRSVVAEASLDRWRAHRLESVALYYRTVLEGLACPA
jgi:hypothetical protein